MHLTRIIDIVVSIQKSPSLVGERLLPIHRVSADGGLPASSVSRDEAAVDPVGAGTGELVLLSNGSSVRHIFSGPNEVINLIIVGVVGTLSH